MRDPYLYPDSNVLKNKLNITDQSLLEDAEADYAVYRLKEIALNPIKGSYDTEHFLKMHYYIFQDLYDWAGEPRKEQRLHFYNAYFSDGTNFSKREYLERIVYDALASMDES